MAFDVVVDIHRSRITSGSTLCHFPTTLALSLSFSNAFDIFIDMPKYTQEMIWLSVYGSLGWLNKNCVFVYLVAVGGKLLRLTHIFYFRIPLSISVWMTLSRRLRLNTIPYTEGNQEMDLNIGKSKCNHIEWKRQREQKNSVLHGKRFRAECLWAKAYTNDI